MSLLDTASLIVTPNGYKEGKLYSVIPSDGSGDLSVTRATTATRVNSAGLVELVPYNLFGYSEDFSNAYWTKYLTNVTSNVITAPNGTTTADLFISTGSGYVYSSFISLSADVYTASYYVKKNNTSWVALTVSNGIATDCTSWYNIDNQTLGNTSGSITITNRTIEDEGNGWLRLTLTISLAASGSFIFLPQFVQSNGSGSVNGDRGYIWGAQLVEGSVAKDYQKTETRLNIPRLDYSNGTCPSILVEPQRTNELLYSSSFDNAAWIKLNGSVTANATTSPDGTTNADSFIPNTTSGFHALRSNNFNQSSTTSHSWFLKANGYSKIAVRESDLAVGNYASFDLSTGTLISTSQSGIIENVGNGWYRCTLVDTNTGAGAQTSIFVLPDSYTTGDPLIAWSGDGIKGVFAYGAQAELGSYPTSYIPTTSASVTRNADVISKTGISSLIGSSEYTLFWDGKHIPTGQYNSFATCYQASNVNNSVRFYRNNSNNAIRAALFNTSSGLSLDLNSGITTENAKCALRVKAGDYAFFVNGSLVASSSSALAPSSSLDALNIQYFDAAQSFQQELKGLAFWKTALTDTQLAQLTTI